MKDQLSNPPLIQYPDTISYCDGSETILYDIVSEPYFDEFSAWQNKSNWALYYHLSPLRKNILSWINFGKKPLKILELGAGCGAITSYLITVPDSEIVAVEGSIERARVIQSRCNGAKNLTIHSCSIDAFKPEHNFDIITLIGVLEYAGKYEQGNDPFSSLLKRASGWLSDQGSLIVAIENQLGYKYISGCPEDHYGTAYEGINDYPHYNGVKTFTKSRLSEKLINSGLAVQSWYYPYPDYKLPGLIYSDLAFDNSTFDYMALTDIPPEPNENANPAFSDRSFLKLIQQVTSVTSFMNSFLVVASKSSQSDFLSNNSGIIAVKPNVKFRCKPFQTSTIFSRSDNRISVFKKRIYPDCSFPQSDIILHLDGVPEPYYHETISIFDAIVNLVLENRYDQAFELINGWTCILNKNATGGTEESIRNFNQFSSRNLNHAIYTEAFGGNWLPGSFVDLTPLNILIPRENPVQIDQCKIIDLEWQLPFDIPLQLVFDRGLALFIQKLHRIVKTHKIDIHSPSMLPSQLYNLIKEMPLFRSANSTSHSIFETWFQHTIMGKVNTPPLELFVETVVSKVEQGKNSEALEYYHKYRNCYSGVPDLKQFDQIMGSIRGREG